MTSNIWGTKFHILGTTPYLPENLGHILYKTSLLHLQPRQMTITVTEIQGEHRGLSRDPNFSPAKAVEEDSDQSCKILYNILKNMFYSSLFKYRQFPPFNTGTVYSKRDSLFSSSELYQSYFIRRRHSFVTRFGVV